MKREGWPGGRVQHEGWIVGLGLGGNFALQGINCPILELFLSVWGGIPL